MTTDAPIDAPGGRTPEASRRWRALWRIHFYSGMFAFPFILFMAVTGLVILYTQPLQDATGGELRTVSAAATEAASYDAQALAVEATYPDFPLVSMTTPVDDHHSTIFGVDDGSSAGRQVFVNPYTATVLGDEGTGSGVVGLANRLHGYLNNDRLQISLPTASALWDGGAVMRKYVIGDLALEALGTWTLLLVMSGLYLWWPRRSAAAAAGAERRGRRAFAIRWSKPGRARWRDLHGLSGVLLFGAMVLTIVSGLVWSAYWGPNFAALADKVSPNTWTDAPPSVLGVRGDLDRLGNQIPWNTADRPIPASYAPTDPDAPAPLTLDAVTRIAAEEGMKPGYTVNFPANAVDETTGETVYGTFGLSNSWPRKTGEARDLFLDQFNGTTVADHRVYGYGSVSRTMDTLVSVHMGTQLGLFTRIMMTAMCLLAMWSVTSAMVMFWKRRRPGTLGAPRRPVDVRFARRITVTAWLMAIVFPVWGATAAVVLAVDRLVIRRSRLRTAFGHR